MCPEPDPTGGALAFFFLLGTSLGSLGTAFLVSLALPGLWEDLHAE